ncbi:hypothetical protein AA313_de0200490 [Arthrobotrys entomopaga]|nr:hypothetical protein AA313_de0200490 [Arthrobotrys entomopaga]
MVKKSKKMKYHRGGQATISKHNYESSDDFIKFHKEDPNANVIYIPQPGSKVAANPETATLWSIATTVTEDKGNSHSLNIISNLEDDVESLCSRRTWSTSEPEEENPKSKLRPLWLLQRRATDEESNTSSLDNYDTPKIGTPQFTESEHSDYYDKVEIPQDEQSLTIPAATEPSRLSRVPSAVSCTTIWPADISSMPMRQTKDPNFLPPPVRDPDPEPVHTDIYEYGNETEEEEEYPRNVYYLTGDSRSSINVIHQENVFQFFVFEPLISHASSILGGKIFEHETIPGTPPASAPFTPNGPRLIANLDPHAMHQILKILHSETDDDLFNIDFEELKQIAVVCQRFELQAPLRPWIRIWLEKHQEPINTPGHEDWLLISHAFGRGDGVKELISTLAEECSTVSDCDSYLLRKGVPVSKELWPDSCLEKILSLRQKQVEGIVNGLRSFLQSILADDARMQEHCSDERCMDMTYGSLLRSVRKLGLWHLLNYKEEWHGSVVDLLGRVNEIWFNTLETIDPSHKCKMGEMRLEV